MTTEKNFFEAMENLENTDDPIALATLLWDSWTIGCANGEERYITQGAEARKFFVRYMSEYGMQVTEDAPLTLMFNAFVAGVGLALETFMPKDTESKE